MRFVRGDVRDHTQKRPRIFVSALQSLAAVETSKNRLSRDFRSRSISAFATVSGAKQTCREVLAMPAFDPERKSRALANGRAVVKSFFCPGLIPSI
jgi:hypothetical protein